MARLLPRGPIAALGAVIAALGILLVPATTSAAPQTENPLPENGWTATASTSSPAGDAPGNAIDGNINTRFSSEAPQAPGMWFQVNLGSPQNVDQIELDAGPSTTDYAAGYQVEVSSNGSAFTSVATGTGTSSPQIIGFAAQTTQYLRVVLTASTQTPWWSIAEFTAFTSGPVNTPPPSTCPRTRPAGCTSTSVRPTASTTTSSSSPSARPRSTWTPPGSTGSG